MERRSLPPTVYERTLMLHGKMGFGTGLPPWVGKADWSDDRIFNWMSDHGMKGDQRTMATYWLHKFAVSGQNRYIVTPELASMLTATEYKSLPCSLLKMPHEVFCLSLIGCGFRMAGMSVTDVMIVRNKGIYMEFFGGPNDTLDANIMLRPGPDDDIMALVENQYDLGGKYPPGARPDLIACLKFIFSVILYINSKSPDMVIVQPKKLFKKDSGVPASILGTVISLNKKKYGIHEAMSEHEIRVLKWPVRGHFRNQACGKNRSEHELIWIEPYFKGSERNSDITAKPHNYAINE